MIKEISIKNFALIEDISIKFEEGLNIIMGETGSGKSNIIDSISILLGERAQKDKIRKGTDKAFIIGAFDISNNTKLIDYLKDKNLYIEDELLVISRELFLKSNNVSRINNTIVPVSMIKEISKYLLDVYGQFENITILSKAEQRKFIDNLGDYKHKNLLSDYNKYYNRYIKLIEEIENYKRSPEEVNRDLEFLNYQIEDIESSGVLDIIEEDLDSRLEIIENSQELKDETSKILNYLDHDDQSIIINLGRSLSFAENITSMDSSFEENSDRLSKVLIEIEDIKREIIFYFENLDYDEEEYKNLDKQRSLLFESKRKYGASINEIKEYLEDAKVKVEEILNYENNLEIKTNELKSLKINLVECAEKLSISRKEISSIFTKKIIEQLKDLEMGNSKFHIKMDPISINQYGKDEITFYISFNKNEPLKEFSSVASGGEISRFMLAVKSIEADKEKTPTLIFDEIDTGISGNAGNIVGNKLKSLTNNHQLICISHLPQIISKADVQFLVYKSVVDNKTKSNVLKLDYDSRIVELAKVIEGDNYSKHTYNTAKKMIDDNKR